MKLCFINQRAMKKKYAILAISIIIIAASGFSLKKEVLSLPQYQRMFSNEADSANTMKNDALKETKAADSEKDCIFKEE